MDTNMSPLEALADAIMQFEGWRRDTRSWRNRNPGNLRPTNPTQLSLSGYRVFESLADGFSALLEDLRAKFNGSHGLTSESTLLDLLNIYAPAGDANDPSGYTKFVCGWTSYVLQRNITPQTTLGEYYANTNQVNPTSRA
jgi:hypothetical protein